MKRITVFCLALVMLLCCGCTPKQSQTGTFKAEKYVIALNPSVMEEDGTVISLRNNLASSMSSDIKAKKSSLYENTPWQWLTHTENGEWQQRLIRELSLWTNKNGSPYAYKTDNELVSSLGVYDAGKMDIKAENAGELGDSGVLMSITGDKEEAICYTAEKDGLAEFADRSGGKIALVDSIAGVSTAKLGEKGAKKAIALRIYLNNRIYWQEVLTTEKTAVDFPVFTSLELTAGDSILFTAQAIDDAESIACGNCDLPASTVIVKDKVKNVNSVKYQTTEPTPDEIPFVFLTDCNFSFVISSKLSVDTKKYVNGIIDDVETVIDIPVNRFSDDDSAIYGDYFILVGDTYFEESKNAINEIKQGRATYGADYIIRMTGNKLVIAAANETGLKFAMEFFLKNYCRDEKSAIKTNLNYVSSKYNTLKSVKINGTSIDKYKIVTSRFASFMDIQAANYLSEQILRITGKSISVVKDSEKESNNEILIGSTNRTASNYSVIANKSADNDYTITVKNSKTIVDGNSSAAINAGVQQLSSVLQERIALNNGFSYRGKYDGKYSLTGGYKLTWADEFNGTKLSKTWSYTQSSYPSVYGGTSYTTSENNYFENGALVQRLNKVGNDIHEADIRTRGSEAMYYRYGYMEMRIRLADSKGSWGAFWMMGQSGNTHTGEIDVFENFGDLDRIRSNLHIWGQEGAHRNLMGGTGTILNYSPGTTSPEPYSENYHTMGLEWSKGYFAFYVDGERKSTFNYNLNNEQACFDQPFSLQLSHWGGRAQSAFADCILPDGFTETNIYYDWIRIYQQDDSGSVMYVKK